MRIAMPTAAVPWRRSTIAALVAAFCCFANGAAKAQGAEIPPRDTYQDRGRGGQG